MMKRRLPPDPLLRELNELLTAPGVEEARGQAPASSPRAIHKQTSAATAGSDTSDSARSDAALLRHENDSQKPVRTDAASSVTAAASEAEVSQQQMLHELEQLLAGIRSLETAPPLRPRSRPLAIDQAQLNNPPADSATDGIANQRLHRAIVRGSNE